MARGIEILRLKGGAKKRKDKKQIK